jgi:hypothetical protein
LFRGKATLASLDEVSSDGWQHATFKVTIPISNIAITASMD